MKVEKIVKFGDIVEDNGKTIRENNLEEKHNIPIGTLVEVKYDKWYTNGACYKRYDRLFVVKHTRDCDGTPLYSLANSRDYLKDYSQDAFLSNSFIKNSFYGLEHGFSEENLTPIELSDDVMIGRDVLSWDKDS